MVEKWKMYPGEGGEGGKLRKGGGRGGTNNRGILDHPLCESLASATIREQSARTYVWWRRDGQKNGGGGVQGSRARPLCRGGEEVGGTRPAEHKHTIYYSPHNMKGERRRRRGGQVPFWLVPTACSAGRRRRRWGMARGRTTPYFFAPNVCKLLKGLPPPPTKRRRRRKQRGWMIGGPPPFIAARFTSQQTWPTKQLATGPVASSSEKFPRSNCGK